MEKTTLAALVNKRGQAFVARALGVKPASIAKAIKVGRQITVTAHDDGTFSAFELRPFPSPNKVA